MNIVQYYEHIQAQRPPLTWQDYYDQRRRSGGCHRAAVMFANEFAPHDTRPLPDWSDVGPTITGGENER